MKRIPDKNKPFKCIDCNSLYYVDPDKKDKCQVCASKNITGLTEREAAKLFKMAMCK